MVGARGRGTYNFQAQKFRDEDRKLVLLHTWGDCWLGDFLVFEIDFQNSVSNDLGLKMSSLMITRKPNMQFFLKVGLM